jgi:hypothetical protein
MKRPVLIYQCTLLLLLSNVCHAQVFALHKKTISEENTYVDHRNPEEAYTLRITSYSPSNLRDELMAINSSDVRTHMLDEGVAKRLHLFEETYVYYSEAAPGAFSDQKVIRRPVIYNSISKIDKYFRRLVRTEEITKVEGSAQLSRILETAIILFYYNAEEFDLMLKDASSVKEEARIFETVQIIE